MTSQITAATQTVRSVERTTPLEEILQIVNDDGGVIIRNFVSASDIAAINADVDDALARLAPGPGDPDDTFFGNQTKRLTDVISLSKTFRERVLSDDLMYLLTQGVLSPYAKSWWLSTAQVIELGPGQPAQILHRDGDNYPLLHSCDGPHTVVNFLLALSEYTEEIGATRVIPGSNKWADFTEHGTPDDTVPAVMEPGSVLFISGKVVHGGGHNVTTDGRRRALSVGFNLGWLTPEEAYPFEVSVEVARSLPPRVQQYLGFRSFTDESGKQPPLWQVNYKELADHLGL